jgi:hypothetical protein
MKAARTADNIGAYSIQKGDASRRDEVVMFPMLKMFEVKEETGAEGLGKILEREYGGAQVSWVAGLLRQSKYAVFARTSISDMVADCHGSIAVWSLICLLDLSATATKQELCIF